MPAWLWALAVYLSTAFAFFVLGLTTVADQFFPRSQWTVGKILSWTLSCLFWPVSLLLDLLLP